MRGSRASSRWFVAAIVLIAVVTFGVPPAFLESGTRVPVPAVRSTERRLAPADSLEAPTRRQRLEALLGKRARAVRTRSETAFMSSVDPEAPPGFRRRQRALFRNLAEVPLTEWTYRLKSASDAASHTLAEPAVPPDELLVPEVTLSYALAGVDTVPVTRPTGFLFALRDGNWYLTGTGKQARDPAWWGPWHFGRCLVIRTDSGLVLGHEGSRVLTRRVARMLDRAVAEVTEVWGPHWSQQVGILVPDSRAELRAQVGPTFAVDDIAAVAVADEVNVETDRVEGPRIVFNTRTANSLSDTALRVVLRHEITHIAARADTVDDAPMWMLEGFADYVGYRGSGVPPRRIAPDLARLVRQEGPPTALPSNSDFRLSGDRLDLAYQQSWSVVRFLVGRIGEQRVVELYHRIAASRSRSTVDAALRELTTVSRSELVTLWRRHLIRLYG